jgi:hypothetical protein
MTPEASYFKIKKTNGPPAKGWYPVLMSAGGKVLLTGPLCFTRRGAELRASEAIGAVRHLSDEEPIR